MCGLCGILSNETHWSDRSVADGPSDQMLHRRDRMRRVAFVNKILKPFACTLSDWQGASYMLSTFTGKTEMIASLADLWPQVERLSGHKVDPLAVSVITSLKDQP